MILVFSIEFDYKGQKVKAQVWKIPAYLNFPVEFHIYNFRPRFTQIPDPLILVVNKKEGVLNFIHSPHCILFVEKVICAIKTHCFETKIDFNELKLFSESDNLSRGTNNNNL